MTSNKNTPKCGLCGKTENLTKTECCNNWICDDEGSYVMFSYDRNSCSRNHSRQTLCAYHYNEEHDGEWKTCKECKEGFDTEDYVCCGTNEYNFEKLANPPKFKPTQCAKCKKTINRMTEGFVMSNKGYFCDSCSNY